MYGEKGKAPTPHTLNSSPLFCFMTLELIQAMETIGVADEGEGKSDRTFVMDKSAKLEAKLERENKKKMVRKKRKEKRKGPGRATGGSTDVMHPSLLGSPSKEWNGRNGSASLRFMAWISLVSQ
jgi:hypothetical protein